MRDNFFHFGDFEHRIWKKNLHIWGSKSKKFCQWCFWYRFSSSKTLDRYPRRITESTEIIVDLTYICQTYKGIFLQAGIKYIFLYTSAARSKRDATHQSRGREVDNIAKYDKNHLIFLQCCHFVSSSDSLHFTHISSAECNGLLSRGTLLQYARCYSFYGSGSTACAQGGCWLIAGSTYQRELSQKALFFLSSHLSLSPPVCFLLVSGLRAETRKITPGWSTGCRFLQGKPAANSQGDFSLGKHTTCTQATVQ